MERNEVVKTAKLDTELILDASPRLVATTVVIVMMMRSRINLPTSRSISDTV